MRPLARVVCALIGLCAAAAVWAATPAAAEQPPVWSSLTHSQQEALEPLQREWGAIDGSRKQKWLEVAGRFPKMPEAERQRVQERMSEWARMTPAERGRARLQFQETRQLSAEDRQARWEAYQTLSPEQRRALAQRERPAGKVTSPNEPRASEVAAKRNMVPIAREAVARSVGPTLVQARPGATTTLMTAKNTTPAHQQPGMPKIAATHGFVDPNTLLPQRGPQGAAVESLPADKRNPHP